MVGDEEIVDWVAMSALLDGELQRCMEFSERAENFNDLVMEYQEAVPPWWKLRRPVKSNAGENCLNAELEQILTSPKHKSTVNTESAKTVGNLAHSSTKLFADETIIVSNEPQLSPICNERDTNNAEKVNATTVNNSSLESEISSNLDFLSEVTGVKNSLSNKTDGQKSSRNSEMSGSNDDVEKRRDMNETYVVSSQSMSVSQSNRNENSRREPLVNISNDNHDNSILVDQNLLDDTCNGEDAQSERPNACNPSFLMNSVATFDDQHDETVTFCTKGKAQRQSVNLIDLERNEEMVTGDGQKNGSPLLESSLGPKHSALGAKCESPTVSDGTKGLINTTRTRASSRSRSSSKGDLLNSKCVSFLQESTETQDLTEVTKMDLPGKNRTRLSSLLNNNDATTEAMRDVSIANRSKTLQLRQSDVRFSASETLKGRQSKFSMGQELSPLAESEITKVTGYSSTFAVGDPNCSDTKASNAENEIVLSNVSAKRKSMPDVNALQENKIRDSKSLNKTRSSRNRSGSSRIYNQTSENRESSESLQASHCRSKSIPEESLLRRAVSRSFSGKKNRSLLNSPSIINILSPSVSKSRASRALERSALSVMGPECSLQLSDLKEDDTAVKLAINSDQSEDLNDEHARNKSSQIQSMAPSSLSTHVNSREQDTVETSMSLIDAEELSRNRKRGAAPSDDSVRGIQNEFAHGKRSKSSGGVDTTTKMGQSNLSLLLDDRTAIGIQNCGIEKKLLKSDGKDANDITGRTSLSMLLAERSVLSSCGSSNVFLNEDSQTEKNYQSRRKTRSSSRSASSESVKNKTREQLVNYTYDTLDFSDARTNEDNLRNLSSRNRSFDKDNSLGSGTFVTSANQQTGRVSALSRRSSKVRSERLSQPENVNLHSNDSSINLEESVRTMGNCKQSTHKTSDVLPNVVNRSKIRISSNNRTFDKLNGDETHLNLADLSSTELSSKKNKDQTQSINNDSQSSSRKTRSKSVEGHKLSLNKGKSTSENDSGITNQITKKQDGNLVSTPLEKLALKTTKQMKNSVIRNNSTIQFLDSVESNLSNEPLSKEIDKTVTNILQTELVPQNQTRAANVSQKLSRNITGNDPYCFDSLCRSTVNAQRDIETPLKPTIRKSIGNRAAYRVRRSVSFIDNKYGKEIGCQTSFQKSRFSRRSMGMQTSRRSSSFADWNRPPNSQNAEVQVSSSLNERRSRVNATKRKSATRIDYYSFGAHTIAAIGTEFEESSNLVAGNARDKVVSEQTRNQENDPFDVAKTAMSSQNRDKADFEDVESRDPNHNQNDRGTNLDVGKTIIISSNKNQNVLTQNNVELEKRSSGRTRKTREITAINSFATSSKDLIGSPVRKLSKKQPNEELEVEQNYSQFENLIPKFQSTRIFTERALRENDNNVVRSEPTSKRRRKRMPVIKYLDEATGKIVNRKLTYNVVYSFEHENRKFFCRTFPLTWNEMKEVGKPEKEAIQALSEIFPQKMKILNKTMAQEAQNLMENYKQCFHSACLNWEEFLHHFPMAKERRRNTDELNWVELVKFYAGRSQGRAEDFEIDYLDILCSGCNYQTAVAVKTMENWPKQQCQALMKQLHIMAVNIREKRSMSDAARPTRERKEPDRFRSAKRKTKKR
ncbi:uncharacterized protein LOC142353480 isoform X2 [Convolutriloba macropyga]|uniref:uncharacterized protein LOC142353480 isoform X2 n=1 Tax=Convolutriloba macropyga TaxID=536237 RepID=UPI003F52445A